MLAYIIRRLLWTPILLALAAFFVFIMGTIAPGDPAELRLGNRSTPERIERERERMGLNDPIPVRYVSYIAGVLKGDFGDSYHYQGRKVLEILGPRLWVSVQLNIAALIIAVIIGLPLGFYAAKRQGTGRDPAIVISMLILYAMPVFFTAPFLILFFAVQLHWVPAAGWGGVFLNSDNPPGAYDRGSQLGDFRSTHAGEHARGHRAGIRPYGTGQGHAELRGQLSPRRSKRHASDPDDHGIHDGWHVRWIAHYRADLWNPGGGPAIARRYIPA